MNSAIDLDKFIGKTDIDLSLHNEEGTLIVKDYQKCGKESCQKCRSGRGHYGPYYWRMKTMKVGHRQYKQIWKFIGKMD